MLLILPLVALIAIIPLIWNGCSCGHDFDFHILSWMEAATQFQHGNLHPQWAFTPAFNAGEPRFVFYPPLSWTIGAVLGLVLPWTITPIAYTWLALTAAGLGCYRLLRSFATPLTSLFISALYIANPYMLFTAYERTAYAELLAAAWLPLLLHGILRRNVTVLGIAAPVALLWLTNAPAAVIGCYGLGLLTLARLFSERDKGPLQLATRTITGTLLGLGLGAFYILPAAYERRSVQIAMAITDGMRISDNYLFHHTPDPDHDAVLRTASLLAVGLVATTLIALLVALLRKRQSAEDRPMLSSFVMFATIIVLLLTPLSAPIWRHAPELAFLQFPWRFLAILMPILALSVTVALRGLRFTGITAALVSLAAASLLTLTAYRGFRQDCDPEDTVAARLALYHSSAGTDATDEYTPITGDNDALKKSNPPFWLADGSSGAASAGAPGPLHLPIDLVSPMPQTLILNLRDFPAWQISLNEQIVPTRFAREDGLIAIPVPAGKLHVDATYVRGPDQTAGWVISTASLCVLGLLLYQRRRLR
ncbi:hypothetical protein [Granulicella arctica]|uniref:hypothetical protein n=1 Tax=Granulicella arctica TaxID=940613 RepID=UPI0021DF6E4C|nr:hypothetical protein [Granulicella arctica]